MNIQLYSELITLVAKIESKKIELDENRQALNLISEELTGAQKVNDAAKATSIADEWLSTYDTQKKIQRALNKLYKEFRAKVDTDELRCLAQYFNYSTDKSDREFYGCARYELLREAAHIEYKTVR